MSNTGASRQEKRTFKKHFITSMKEVGLDYSDAKKLSAFARPYAFSMYVEDSGMAEYKAEAAYGHLIKDDDLMRKTLHLDLAKLFKFHSPGIAKMIKNKTTFDNVALENLKESARNIEKSPIRKNFTASKETLTVRDFDGDQKAYEAFQTKQQHPTQ